LDAVFSPVILYIGLALGAIGVALALPRRGLSPQALGGLVTAIGLGGLLIAMAIVGGEARASVFFYVFALIGVGAALRVITHPRPVYAALYFILTILSSAGLFLLLSAEFMTFAVIIIYAGAILITYLFVIMLATQAPMGGAVEQLAEYDAASRDPVLSTIVGFALLGVLTGMMTFGTSAMPDPGPPSGQRALAQMPKKIEAYLAEIGILEEVVTPIVPADAQGAQDPDWRADRSFFNIIAPEAATEERIGFLQLTLKDPERFQARLDAATGEAPQADVEPLPAEAVELMLVPQITDPDRTTGRQLAILNLPPRLSADNIEHVGLALVGENPLSLELAGVILLLAMLGAVVLARKQTEVEEERKALQAEQLGLRAAQGRPAP